MQQLQPSTTVQALREMVQAWQAQQIEKTAQLEAAQAAASAARPTAPADLPTSEQIAVAEAMDGIKNTTTATAMLAAVETYQQSIQDWQTDTATAKASVQTLTRDLEALKKVIAEAEMQELVEMGAAASSLIPGLREVHAEAVQNLIQATALLSAAIGLERAPHRAAQEVSVYGHRLGIAPFKAGAIDLPTVENPLLNRELIQMSESGRAILSGDALLGLSHDAMTFMMGQLRGEV